MGVGKKRGDRRIEPERGKRMDRRSWVLCGSVMLALSGCGGDNSGGDKSAARGESGGDERSTPSGAGAPDLDAVLACMKREGAKASGQSSSTGPKIGIDYPAGRLIVSFEESEKDAELRASVAKAQDPGSTAVQKGTVVITAPADPAAAVGTQIAERCVE
jgi:hypothetical protein